MLIAKTLAASPLLFAAVIFRITLVVQSDVMNEFAVRAMAAVDGVTERPLRPVYPREPE